MNVKELDPEGCGEDYDFRPWRQCLYRFLLPMGGRQEPWVSGIV